MLPVAIANFPIGASPADWQSANGLVACTHAAVMLCFQETLHVDDLCGQCTKPAIESRLSTQPRAIESRLHQRSSFAQSFRTLQTRHFRRIGCEPVGCLWMAKNPTLKPQKPHVEQSVPTKLQDKYSIALHLP